MEGRYRAYPEYKGSKSEWIGEIPSHWKEVHLKHIVDMNRQITYGIVQAGPNVEDGIPYIRPVDMTDVNGIVNFDGILRTSKTIADNYRRSEVKCGDIVCSIGPSFGKLMITPRELNGANLTQGTARIAISSTNSNRFVFWALRSSSTYQQWESSVGGATFRALNLGPLAETFLVLPNINEQHQIANFLDHETAKIDTLIEKQQQLIALLKEKRQAVISHAVTKGLTPDAPMKDSGVEWLGEMPEHWGVSRVKFHSLVKGRIGFRGYTVEDLVDENEGALVIGATEMTFSGSIELKSPQYISWEKYYESPEIMLEAGMILIVQRGSTVGKVAYIKDGLGKATINPSLIVLKNMEIEPRYLSFSLMESRIQNVVRMQTSSTAIPMISQEQVGNYYILIPPKEEQVDICAYIDNKAKAVEIAINASNKSIKLLQERRTALISAAVTGKIDVRNWQPPTDKDIQ
jgi:type I restriction enzyme S subunit